MINWKEKWNRITEELQVNYFWYFFLNSYRVGTGRPFYLFLGRPVPRMRVLDWGLPSQIWHWRMQSNHFRRRRRHWLRREASAAKRLLRASSDENLQIKWWHYLICRFSSLLAPRILLATLASLASRCNQWRLRRLKWLDCILQCHVWLGSPQSGTLILGDGRLKKRSYTI